jgi:2-oxo-3-hexenedioate decarboxylase
MIVKSDAPVPIRELARELDSAMSSAREIERLTARHPALTLDDAYLIQEEGIRLRQGRGEQVIGLKMGFTSEAKRQQMGLGSPIYGMLTDRMGVQEGSEMSLAGLIHPKIEPEIAFVVARDLHGPVTPQEALEACESVFAAMEILDSRFTGFKYFSLPDVVADNCSSCRYVLGTTRHDPRSFDFADLGRLAMTMEVNGKPAQSAPSSAISGHPVNSLVQLCELLAPRGLSIPAGSVVLAGAATQAVALEPGMKIKLTVEELGRVELRIA